MEIKLPPVHVAVSLAESRISLGEPIVLRYEFVGTQAEEVSLYMGTDKRGWLVLTLSDSEGSQAPPVPDPRMRQGGMHGYGIGVSATSHAVEYVVVNRDLRPTHPGDYRLSARGRTPYKMRSQTGVSPRQWEQAFGTVLAWEDTFSLTLTALDPARLRAVAERLAAQAAQEEDRVTAEVALQSLFAMPEAYALTTWQAVAASENPRFLDRWGVISDELARVQSIGTASILSEMVWNPPPAVRERLRVSYPGCPGLNLMAMNNVAMKYNNMYFTADPALKQHIAELYLARGSGPPESRIMI